MLQLVGQNTTVKLLAEELSRSLDRPVIDRTGIQGEYSFPDGVAPFTRCSVRPVGVHRYARNNLA